MMEVTNIAAQTIQVFHFIAFNFLVFFPFLNLIFNTEFITIIYDRNDIQLDRNENWFIGSWYSYD